jgi:hypothetical protein
VGIPANVRSSSANGAKNFRPRFGQVAQPNVTFGAKSRGARDYENSPQARSVDHQMSLLPARMTMDKISQP